MMDHDVYSREKLFSLKEMSSQDIQHDLPVFHNDEPSWNAQWFHLFRTSSHLLNLTRLRHEQQVDLEYLMLLSTTADIPESDEDPWTMVDYPEEEEGEEEGEDYYLFSLKKKD